MPLGNHQHVDRRWRVNVLEREHLVVLQNDLGRNLPGADLAKETIRHESLPPRLFFFESAFAEPPGQLLVDLGRWNLVIAERDQQMKQEVRRLVHDLLALLPFGSEAHFPSFLGHLLQDYVLAILEQRGYLGLRGRSALAL